MYLLKKYFKYFSICCIPIIAHKIYSNYHPAIKRYNKETFKFEKIHTDCIFGPKNFNVRKMFIKNL